MKKSVMIRRRFLIQFALGSAGVLAAPLTAHTQLRSQPIKLIFPYVPGGTGDALARIIAEQMQESLHQPVIVDNRSGANGRIGTAAVKNAEPDGLTLLITPGGPMTLAPHYVKSLGYDTINDFEPISQIVTMDYSVAAAKNVPVKTMKEFVAWLKTNPDKAVYGHPVVGGGPHFLGLLLGRRMGVDLTPIGYRGSAAALRDLVAGQIPMLVTLTSDVIEQHRGGTIRVLATTDKGRSRYLTDVPTLIEAGYDIEGRGWYGVYAPAKTPASIIERYNKVIVEALHSPDVKARIEKMGFAVTGTSPTEHAAMQKAESDMWAPVVKASGLQGD